MNATATRRKPAAPTEPGTIRGVETFAPVVCQGDKEGEVWRYSDQDVGAIVRNFAILSKGEAPLHRVPVVVTHDGAHAYGWASDCYDIDPMLTDWEHVAPALKKAIEEKSIAKVSAEIKENFTDRTGKVYPGPYLYRVTVHGAIPPRVKGLADIPADQFADPQPGRRVERTFRFADPMEPPMTRDQALQILADQLGIDPATVDAAVPDAFIIAVATALQGAGDTANPDGTSKTGKDAMSDPAVNPKKVTVTQHFADQLDRVKKAEEAAIARIEAATQAVAKATAEREREERQASVRMFCDRMTHPSVGKLSPADNDEGSPLSVRSRLLRLAAQPQVVHRFADPVSKAEIAKTELQLQQEEIERQPARKFSERVRTSPNDQPADPLRANLEKYYDERIKRLPRQTSESN